MKIALFLFIATFCAFAETVFEHRDHGSYSMTAPELLTSSRFVYLKNVQYKHLANPKAHGILVLMEGSEKLLEKKVDGCGRPRRLSGEKFLLAGCGFVSVFDFDGNLLLSKTADDSIPIEHLTALTTNELYVASSPVAQRIDLQDLSVQDLNCGGKRIGKLFSSNGKVFAQALSSQELYRIDGEVCALEAQVDGELTHVVSSGDTLGLRTKASDIRILNKDRKVVRSFTIELDEKQHPIVSAKTSLFPGLDGSILVLARSVKAKYRSGWFGGAWHYDVTWNFYSYGQTGKLMAKRFFDKRYNILQITQTSTGDILLINQNNVSDFRSGHELLDARTFRTRWSVSPEALELTKSWTLASTGNLVGNRGEVLDPISGTVLKSARVPYAEESTASVLTENDLMVWNYQSVYDGPGQWAMQYFLINE